MTLMWTAICMSFPALDALREGYDVYTMTDAIADTHRRRASQFEEGT
jgi:nicotinamidase-related amidase